MPMNNTSISARVHWQGLYVKTSTISQLDITFLTWQVTTLGSMTQIGSFLLAKASTVLTVMSSCYHFCLKNFVNGTTALFSCRHSNQRPYF